MLPDADETLASLSIRRTRREKDETRRDKGTEDGGRRAEQKAHEV